MENDIERDEFYCEYDAVQGNCEFLRGSSEDLSKHIYQEQLLQYVGGEIGWGYFRDGVGHYRRGSEARKIVESLRD